VVPDHDGLPDIAAALGILAIEFGVTRLFCEGGGKLAASLLAANLVDELILFQAGKVIGDDGLPSVRGFGLETLGDAPQFSLSDVRAVGPDVISVWRSKL
jgi:diaminohydroxyphosphoribosylaminopyrimidine deaminase/5-amino-6-(5-phosphoribosylamino)uracil reductase